MLRKTRNLQSIAPTNQHWVRVVGYSPFSLCVIHKEGQCPSSGDINRLIMVMVSIDIYGVLWLDVDSSLFVRIKDTVVDSQCCECDVLIVSMLQVSIKGIDPI
jgi:hypothetical protein